MPFPCPAHAVPLPCRAAKRLECVFPIWFTQWGRVWFTLALPCPCHAPTTPFFWRPQHSTAVERRLCCAVALRRTAWSEHAMASVNQKRPHCVNQVGKTHYKPLAAWHGRGTAWVRHGHGMLRVNRLLEKKNFEKKQTHTHTHTSETSLSSLWGLLAVRAMSNRCLKIPTQLSHMWSVFL